MKKVSLLRPSYFVWTIVPVAAIALYLAIGLPHLIWSYDWRPSGSDSYSDFSQRYYTRCTYVGPYGPIVERPADGTCGLIRFAKKPVVWG